MSNFISILIVIAVARETFIWILKIVLYLFLSSVFLCKHQPVNDLYSSCFVISGYGEIIVFVKMAIPINEELSWF